MFDEPEKKKRRTIKRPSLFDTLTLSDGRLAWPVAQAVGLPEVLFRKRLKSMSPDEAIAMPYQPQNRARAAARRLARAEYARRAEQERRARRAASRWPARLDVLHDAYSGVIWSDGEIRLIVSPKGHFYNLQSKDEAGDWSDDRRAREASQVRDWLALIALDPPAGLVAAADQIPNNPASCELVPIPSR